MATNSQQCLYADDVIVLTPTRGSMQKLLDIAGEYANDFGLKFNVNKCKLIIFSDRPLQMQPVLLDNIALNHDDSEKHLGHLLSNKGDYIDFTHIITDLKAKANVLGREFYFLDWESKCKLFNANCTSFYGCNILDISSGQMNKLCIAWRKSIKYLMNLDMRTHTVLLPHIIGSPSAEQIIHSRIISFMKLGFEHESEVIAFFFKHCIYFFNSYMCRNLNLILSKYDLTMSKFLETPANTINKRIKQIQNVNDWRNSVIKELMLCREGQLHCGLSPEEISCILRDVCVS